MRRSGCTDVIVALLLCAASAHAGPDAGPETGPVDVEAEARVYFSRTTETDSIVVRIAGATLEDATFSVTVESRGEVIYAYATPLGDIVPLEWLTHWPERLDRTLTNLVNRAAGLGRAGNPPSRKMDGPGLFRTHEDFEFFRGANIPLLCHPYRFEGNVCVGVDPRSLEVVEVLRMAQ